MTTLHEQTALRAKVRIARGYTVEFDGLRIDQLHREPSNDGYIRFSKADRLIVVREPKLGLDEILLWEDEVLCEVVEMSPELLRAE